MRWHNLNLSLTSGGVAAPTITANANPTHINGGFSSPITFNNVATGTGLVVVCVQVVNAATFSGVTLNGAAMALAVSSTITSSRSAQIWYLGGQSANANSTIVLTGGASAGTAIQTYTLTGCSSTPNATATLTYGNPASPYNVGPINVPTTGFGIASYFFDAGTAPTPTAGAGVTIDFQADDGNLLGLSAHMGDGANQTCSIISGNFAGSAAAFASWGP